MGTANTGPMPISSGSQPATAKPRKRPSGLRLCLLAYSSLTTTQAPAPSENWLALPAEITPPGSAGLDAADAFLGRAFAQALVLADGDFLGAQAHHRVGHAGLHGDRRDLVVELACGLRGAGLLLAGRAVLVHRVARRCCSAWRPARRSAASTSRSRACACSARGRQHVLVHLLLHAGDALHAAGHVDVAFAGDDALRGHGDGLQARGAEAVDGDAATR